MHLQTLLLQVSPSEIVHERGTLSPITAAVLRSSKTPRFFFIVFFSSIHLSVVYTEINHMCMPRIDYERMRMRAYVCASLFFRLKSVRIY